MVGRVRGTPDEATFLTQLFLMQVSCGGEENPDAFHVGTDPVFCLPEAPDAPGAEQPNSGGAPGNGSHFDAPRRRSGRGPCVSAGWHGVRKRTTPRGWPSSTRGPWATDVVLRGRTKDSDEVYLQVGGGALSGPQRGRGIGKKDPSRADGRSHNRNARTVPIPWSQR